MPEENARELNIRNMVCTRCIMVVRQTLEDLGFTVKEVELGRAEVTADGADFPDMDKIEERLNEYGFELIHEKNQRLVAQIKTHLIQYVQNLEHWEESPKLSDYLSEKIHQNYTSISSIFSESENITIEKFLIHLRIERAKELLSYGEFTLSEISYKLNYSSVAHLSNQFKQITGMSVTDYKKVRDSFRKPLDGLSDSDKK